MKFCSTTKNFYKLFNESEQKAISTLFESEEELNKFKQKIKILENRNSAAEKQYSQEIKDLKKIINEKDDQIKYLNTKIHENEIKFKMLKNQAKEKNTNTISNTNEKKKEKKLTVKQQLKEYGYGSNFKNKNEQLEKMNLIINNLKEELNKYQIEKFREKELNDIKKELEIPDNTKKFRNSFLKVKNEEIQMFIDGNISPGKELKNVKILKNIGKDNKRNNNNNKAKSTNNTIKKLTNRNSYTISGKKK